MRAVNTLILLYSSKSSAFAPTEFQSNFRGISTYLSMSDNNGGCEDGVCRPKGSASTSQGTYDAKFGNSSTAKNILKVDIISDTMCPWCWVGKRNMEKALEDTPDIQPEINWLPFFLDKNLPEEGKPVEEYYIGNYGDPKVGEKMKPHLVMAGKKAGIDFEKSYVKTTHLRPTIRSHRLIEYAKRQGKQDEMVEELFRIYFEEGKHLNSIEHLTESAKKVGLEGNVEEYLKSDQDEKEVFEEAAKMKSHAQGVPTFLFSMPEKNLFFTFSGGQPPEAFKKVFQTFLAQCN